MVRVPPLRTRGFTLIELVVTLAIMVLLLLMAVPLATDWTYSARTLQARGTLVEGFAQAKALALRNPCAAPNATGTHAATLRATTDGEKVTLSVLAQVSESLLAQNDESLLAKGDDSCDLSGQFCVETKCQICLKITFDYDQAIKSKKIILCKNTGREF